MRILIKNAQQVAHPAAVQDIFVAEGKIIAMGAAPAGFVADRTLDASGHWVLPGLVDTTVSLPEPGFPHKGSILSETRAGAAGGILHMLAMPDTRPCLDNGLLVERMHQQAKQAGFATVYPLGALTVGLQGTQLCDLLALQKAGSPAVSNALLPVRHTRTLLQCYHYAANYGIRVVIHAQEPDLSEGTLAQESPLATRLGLSARPACSEALAIDRHVHLIRHSGVRAHFACLSTAQGVAAIRAARQSGLAITASVAMHHLHLTDAAMEGFNNLARLDPPLGSAADRAALRAGVADGTLQAICSDHRPHEETAKRAAFGEAAPGLSGLETFLSLGLHLAQTEVLPLETVLHAMTAGAADCFDLPLGRLAVNGVADIVVVDPKASWLVAPSALRSLGRHTPFTGQRLPGVVTHVIAAGRLLDFS